MLSVERYEGTYSAGVKPCTDCQEDLVGGRVPRCPHRGVKNDALHDVADLMRIETGGRSVQVLVSHDGALELEGHCVRRMSEDLCIVREGQVVKQGRVVKPQRQLFESDLRDSRRSRGEPGMEKGERKVEAPEDVSEHARRGEFFGVRE